jgi:hypothetical protein
MVPGTKKMDDAQIKIHEAALKILARWLTALCTPSPVALTSGTLAEELCVRFIWNVLQMEVYTKHLTDKFLHLAMAARPSTKEYSEVVKSCRGAEDPLLKGLAGIMVQRKMSGEKRMVDAFLPCRGHELLKVEVMRLASEMSFGKS